MNAGELYKSILSRWPTSGRAMWVQMRLAILYIWGSQFAEAERATLGLIDRYSGNAELGDAVHEVVETYFNIGEHDRGRMLYQYLLASQAGDKQTQMELQVGVVLSNMETAGEAATQAAIAKLIADYGEGADLAKGLLQSGEKYYEQANVYKNEGREEEWKEYLRKAVGVWKIILDDLPAAKATEEACYFSGRCYEWLGEYDKAIPCYERVLVEWPTGKNGASAQYHIARSYDAWGWYGGVSRDEAKLEVRKAVTRLISQYPESRLIKIGINLAGGPERFEPYVEGEE